MDIQCNWGSLAEIIDHWGDYGEVLQQSAGPGHWHDPDMLLIGNDCLSIDEQRTQMAIWSISAAPLIMGNDLRKVSEQAKAILLNRDAIAVNQDPLGKMGIRHSSYSSASPTQMWFRELANGDVAVALYFSSAPCAQWNVTEGGFLASCNHTLGHFQDLSLAEAQDMCCQNSKCVGISYKGTETRGAGFYQADQDCGFKKSLYLGYTKHSTHPVQDTDITLDLTQIGFASDEEVTVHDIWLQQEVGTYKGSYTARKVPLHGSAFLRLSKRVSFEFGVQGAGGFIPRSRGSHSFQQCNEVFMKELTVGLDWFVSGGDSESQQSRSCRSLHFLHFPGLWQAWSVGSIRFQMPHLQLC